MTEPDDYVTALRGFADHYRAQARDLILAGQPGAPGLYAKADQYDAAAADLARLAAETG